MAKNLIGSEKTWGVDILFNILTEYDNIEFFEEFKLENPDCFNTWVKRTDGGGYMFLYLLSEKQKIIINRLNNRDFILANKNGLSYIFDLDIRYNQGHKYFNSSHSKELPTMINDKMFEIYVNLIARNDPIYRNEYDLYVLLNPGEDWRIKIDGLTLPLPQKINTDKLKFYLDKLKPQRFIANSIQPLKKEVKYCEWLDIGAILHYHNVGIEMLDDYSRKAHAEMKEEYDPTLIIARWETYNKRPRTPLTIDILAYWASLDNISIKHDINYMGSIANGKNLLTEKILNLICYEGINAVRVAYLFYYHKNYSEKYVFDSFPLAKYCTFYQRNRYGIYKKDVDDLFLLYKDLTNVLPFLVSTYYDTEFNKIKKMCKRPDLYPNIENSIIIKDLMKHLQHVHKRNLRWLHHYKNKEIVIIKQEHKGSQISTFQLNHNNVCNIVSQLTILYENPNRSSKFNQNKSLIGFENGIFDLRSSRLKTDISGEFINMTTGYDYNASLNTPKARCEIMNMFKTIWPKPEELDYFLASLALCLDGDNKSGRFFVWRGAYSKEKVDVRFKISNFVSYCLGNGTYYQNVDSDYFTKRNNGMDKSRTNLEMSDKRYCKCVFGGEINNGINWNMTNLITNTSNDGITYREKGSENVTYLCTWPLFILSNYLPKVTKNSDLLTNMCTIVDFHSNDPNTNIHSNRLVYNPAWDEKMKTDVWKITFFHILLEYRNRNIDLNILPERFQKNPSNILNLNNQIEAFIQDRLTNNLEVPNGEMWCVQSKVLYAEFKTYMNNKIKIKELKDKNSIIKEQEVTNGIMVPTPKIEGITSPNNFSTYFSQKGYVKKTIKRGSPLYFIGLKLRPIPNLQNNPREVPI